MGLVERSSRQLRRWHYTVQVEKSQPRPPQLKEAGAEKPETRRLTLVDKGLRLLAVLVLLGAIGGAVWRVVDRPKDPIPASVKQAASFTLYYPAAEPSGYALDASSIKDQNGTVLYNFTKPGVQPIVITQQTRPSGFDPKTLFQHNPLPTTISPLGTVYDLSYKNQSRFMITALNSLIFISSNSKISGSQLEQIINSLKISK